MKGTEKLFAFIVAASVLGVQVEKALSDDGKISGFKEIYAVGSSAIAQIPVLVEVAPEAFAEAKDLTVVETVDVVLKLKQEKVFAEFSNAKIAKWAEAGLDLVQALLKFSKTGQDDDNTNSELGNVYAALQSIQKAGKQDLSVA